MFDNTKVVIFLLISKLFKKNNNQKDPLSQESLSFLTNKSISHEKIYFLLIIDTMLNPANRMPMPPIHISPFCHQ